MPENDNGTLALVRALPIDCDRTRHKIARSGTLLRRGAHSHQRRDARLSGSCMSDDASAKVPEVTLIFWIIKIAATTLGETGGDTVSMTLNWGYAVGTAIFLSLLVLLVAAQIAARKFQPFLYWATIVASTTAGTTMADFADRSLGIGYTGGAT